MRKISGFILCVISALSIVFSILISEKANAVDAYAADPIESGAGVRDVIEPIFKAMNDFFGAVLFYPIYGFPILVIWLLAGGVFFTWKLGFVNFRLFKHAIDVVRGKYSKDTDPGEVSHFAALTSAVSATVGMGNIGGVALAVCFGGPGAVFWMMVCGFFGMSSKFAEVTMGMKYREIRADGTVNGGAYRYLKVALEKRGKAKLGKFLAIVFAVCCVAGSLGAGNLFQVNTALTIVAHSKPIINEYRFLISIIIGVFVGIVLFGGIKSIVAITSKVVPSMSILYVTCCLIILAVNYQDLGHSIYMIFESAFDFESVQWGFFAAFVNGLRRAFFSSEAGIGSAPTAHSTAKTTEPVREGSVALLEPFLDTIVICGLTGLVIVTTGVYTQVGLYDGAVLTSLAFGTVSSWFPFFLSVSVLLFGFSTIVTWGYYGAQASNFLFGEKADKPYKVIFALFAFFGGVMTNVEIVVNFSDNLFLAMAIPNLIGLYIISGEIKADTQEYIRKLKAGEFEKNEKKENTTTQKIVG